MGRIVPMFLSVVAVFAIASAQELSKEDRIFFEGVNAGLMAKYEGDVVDAFNGLQALQKVAGTEHYRSSLVTKLNTALFALSFVDRDVTMRPEMLKESARLSSPNMKEFMARLRQARFENKWQSSDPTQEERIGRILGRFVTSGNVYGFE